MNIRISLLSALLMFAGAGNLAAQDSASLSQFAGTWVGLQTWTIDNPSATEPQPVTLTLEMVDGNLTGSITPFLGSAQGLAITQARVVGDELHLSADSSQSRNRWQRDVGVSFKLIQEAEELTGSANLTMGDVPWLELDYKLSRKRSRY
jgi:hypothetical protein